MSVNKYMTHRDFKEYTILNAVTPQTVTSSTDATPIVVTKNSHGLATGDTVLIYGHTTNIAANGIRKITVLSANTFSLQDPFTNQNIAGSGGGAGSGGFVMTAPRIISLVDFRNAIIQVGTSGTSTMTLSVAGSLGKLGVANDIPNFGSTVSPSNSYSFVQIIDLDNGNIVDGSSEGIALVATDINKMYEVNTNSIKYLTVFPTAWTAGQITVKILVNTE